MTSRRENFLARAFVVASTLTDDWAEIVRNVPRVDQEERDATILVQIDGEEVPVEPRVTRKGRPAVSGQTPAQEMTLAFGYGMIFGVNPEDRGTEINRRLETLQRTIMHDATLLGYCVSGSWIRYDGLIFDLEAGGTPIAQFSADYLLTVPAPAG